MVRVLLTDVDDSVSVGEDESVVDPLVVLMVDPVVAVKVPNVPELVSPWVVVLPVSEVTWLSGDVPVPMAVAEVGSAGRP